MATYRTPQSKQQQNTHFFFQLFESAKIKKAVIQPTHGALNENKSV